jgi:basic amino acid/polyamine antiporter, APA family
MANTLPRRIGFWSAVAILVGRTIGAGIFRSPASIANPLPGPLSVLSVWAAGGLLALCGALTLAEVAGAIPETGGVYVFIRECWGRPLAFLFGWSELVITRATALAAVATAFAEYSLDALGVNPTVGDHARWVHYLGAATIAVIGYVNYRGVRWGTLVQNVMTLLKCCGLLVLVLLAFILRSGSAPAPTVSPAVRPPLAVISLGVALISVMWVYNGWADVSFVAGEVRDPVRSLPRVLVFGTLVVVALYLLANGAYLHVLPFDELRHSPLVAADVALRLVGPAGIVGISAVVMCATLGTLNGSLLTGSRVFWAMAQDGLLFRRLATVHPRYETPSVAIAVATVLGMVFVSLRTFDQLANTVIIASLPYYALAVGAVFRLRRRPDYRPAFRTIGYPLTPILFIASALGLLAAAFADPAQRLPTTVIFLVMLAGLPMYWWLAQPHAVAL